jgi:hypothetical protein
LLQFVRLFSLSLSHFFFFFSKFLISFRSLFYFCLSHPVVHEPVVWYSAQTDPATAKQEETNPTDATTVAHPVTAQNNDNDKRVKSRVSGGSGAQSSSDRGDKIPSGTHFGL